MVIILSLGVEAAASRAVNEIPTPNGVALVQKTWVLPPGFH